MTSGYLFVYVSIVYMLLGWALNLPYRLRQLHFLAIACSVVGAYAGAIAVLNVGVPWWVALPIVGLLGGIIGFLVSLVVAEALARAAYTSRALPAAQGFSIGLLGRLLQSVSCVLGATAGFLYILPFWNLFPGFFDFGFLGTVVTMVFVGGHGTPYGLFVSVPVLWGLSFVLPDSLENLRLVIYAAALIVVLVLRPEGLVTRRLAVKAVRRLSFGKGDR